MRSVAWPRLLAGPLMGVALVLGGCGPGSVAGSLPQRAGLPDGLMTSSEKDAAIKELERVASEHDTQAKKAIEGRR
ncbi:MAG: hypothetical protein NW217_15680 [Hyphomicrobiaceae bacterium]|nr:hypothetical protein [Hyphomicrobiaceae bacterium]